MTEQRRKRRWFQFSLRTMLLAVLVVSMLLSWVACEMQEGTRQRAALQAVKELGGRVNYDHPNRKTTRSALTRYVEDHFPRGISLIVLEGPAVCDASLEQLSMLTHVTRLNILRAPNVTDAGLEHLKGLTSLESLILQDTQVTPEGVERLQHALPDCQIDLY
jgi:hypothetical protein